jgi:hypothetical protein
MNSHPHVPMTEKELEELIRREAFRLFMGNMVKEVLKRAEHGDFDNEPIN